MSRNLLLLIFGAFTMFNLFYVLKIDWNRFDENFLITNAECEKIDTILINELYNNSFGFTANSNYKISTNTTLYCIKSLESGNLIYFTVATVKRGSSNFFLQHITWKTKLLGKIPKGKYALCECQNLD